ncbi:MAG: hypothetical protein LV473_19565 [Nitrospira sp.]|nr:hypothetical protein [Nitrospira sp.]
MSQDLICRRSWKRRLRGWGTILFLCLLGAVAAIGVRVLIESVGDIRYTRYERVDVSPLADPQSSQSQRSP